MDKNNSLPDSVIRISHGIFGFVILGEFADKAWIQDETYSEYRSGSEFDLKAAADLGFLHLSKEDIMGWYYKESIVSFLLKKGYSMSYLGIEIKEIGDIARIDEQNEQYAKEELQKRKSSR